MIVITPANAMAAMSLLFMHYVSPCNPQVKPDRWDAEPRPASTIPSVSEWAGALFEGISQGLWMSPVKLRRNLYRNRVWVFVANLRQAA